MRARTSKPRTPEQGTLELFAKRWPKAFTRRKPLAIGIHEKIIAALAGIASPKEISRALAVWVDSDSYLKKCSRVGAVRIGFNGEAAGVVNDEQASHAHRRRHDKVTEAMRQRHMSGNKVIPLRNGKEIP